MASDETLKWRWTKVMNMRDLSRDDDFLSHLLVEKLGTGDSIPLLVHKMDPSRRLPKTDANVLLNIVRRFVLSKLPLQQASKQAVDNLLSLHPVRVFLKSYDQKQINAFATHASRYFELYQPGGSIEISHTSRYSHRTGKSELCILATRPMAPGTVITELKGSMANLTDEEDRELKRTNLRATDSGIRRDFSVIHSKSMKKNHLFLGPARFVNHDCDHNAELFREGRYITFRVLRPIAVGQEITAHYGDSYFGRKNRYCLCESCEKKGRGGYDPTNEEESESSDSDSNAADDSSSSSSESDSETDSKALFDDVNERRTRRGVYATTKPEDEEPDCGNDDSPSAPTTSTATPRLRRTVAGPSSATPLSSRAVSASPLTSVTESSSGTPFRSIITTRRQIVRRSAQLPTPPLTQSSSISSSCDTTSAPRRTSARAAAKVTAKASVNVAANPTVVLAKSASIVNKAKEQKGKFKAPQPSPAAAAPPPPPPVPRGPDGKPLPVCSTCKSILPLISVESEVVWGLEFDGKRKQQQDCPRCLRHIAIYGHPWPTRVSRDGASAVPTPRESVPIDHTRKVNPKSLPLVDKKLAAAAEAGRRRSSRDRQADERPTKRPRTESPARQPQRPTVVVSKVVKETAVRTTRNSISARSVRTSLRLTSSSSTSVSPTSSLKKKRGRPRKHPLVERSRTDTSISAANPSQPRGSDGKFFSPSSSVASRKGRKDNESPRSSRAIERDLLKSRSESISVTPRKRARREDPREERRKKRAKMIEEAKSVLADSDASSSSDSDDEDGRHISSDVEVEITSHRFVPKASSFMGGKLGGSGPMTFASRAWAHAKLDGEDSESDAEEHKSFDSPALRPAFWKPNPFAFAARRWSMKTEEEDKQESSSVPSLSVSPTPALDVEQTNLRVEWYASDSDSDLHSGSDY
ncbi:hypothetical protein DL96DRAFT_1602017 [Flagelloscypha sp. PMI_526]|nr:hypothetical protein DL96DRAFT_1602017 [Flagelloscypha sp. PMI_526]